MFAKLKEFREKYRVVLVNYFPEIALFFVITENSDENPGC
jgi:hypothetical protein